MRVAQLYFSLLRISFLAEDGTAQNRRRLFIIGPSAQRGKKRRKKEEGLSRNRVREKSAHCRERERRRIVIEGAVENGYEG